MAQKTYYYLKNISFKQKPYLYAMIMDLSQLDLTKKYSYADYLTWKFTERVELLKGFIQKMSPAASVKHQRISANLLGEFYTYLKNKPCDIFSAPFDVRLINKNASTEDHQIFTVVQPDLCVICDQSKLDARGCIGAPELIIEILSLGNTKRDTQDKFQLYEENGVQEYWIVHPSDETVSVFDLINDKYQLRTIYGNDEKIPALVLEDCVLDAVDIFS